MEITIEHNLVVIRSKTRDFMQAVPVDFPDNDPAALDRLLNKFEERHGAFPLRVESERNT